MATQFAQLTIEVVRCATDVFGPQQPPLDDATWDELVNLCLRGVLRLIEVRPYSKDDKFRATFIEPHLNEEGFLKEEDLDQRFYTDWNGEEISYIITKRDYEQRYRQAAFLLGLDGKWE